jgi:hypothetical protein
VSAPQRPRGVLKVQINRSVADGETACPWRLLWPLLLALRRATWALRNLSAQWSPVLLWASGGGVSIDQDPQNAGKSHRTGLTGDETMRRIAFVLISAVCGVILAPLLVIYFERNVKP